MIEFKIPFKEEIFPILKNLYIDNNHCRHNALANLVIISGFYWEVYAQDIKLFLSKCEFVMVIKKNLKLYPI